MQLLATAYCTIEHDLSRSLVRLTRNAVPYRTIEELDGEIAVIGTVLDGVKGQWRLLVDLRSVPLRNDPAFEAASARLRDRMFRHASRIALVVKTAVGALQVKRHVREDHVDAEVFDDERLAMNYLLRPPSVGTSRRRSYMPTSGYVLVQQGRRF
ncbi:hypothetical protein [Chondromyces crocatus]|uniref:Uncharacterized protein n=1 Tax=Chondromyces crocatus TaxID=52 RepID=A0A0K1EG78_CHOCO|nr:hypothetical protein [Chondromyces crocatus]AKT39876.1 uncharacterized protein CMC5_040270 [Chondromyces crocatus]